MWQLLNYHCFCYYYYIIIIIILISIKSPQIIDLHMEFWLWTKIIFEPVLKFDQRVSLANQSL